MRAGITALALLSAVTTVVALGEPEVLVFPSDDDIRSPFHIQSEATISSNAAETFLIASAPSHVVPILLDSDDDVAVHIAARTFANDVYRVSGTHPVLYNDTLPVGIEHAMIVGTVGSRVIREVNAQHLSALDGKWESFDARIVERPLKGIKAGLVVAGSDRVSVPDLFQWLV